MTGFTVPAVVRGEVVEADSAETTSTEFGARGHGTFSAPDPLTILDRLTLAAPGDLADLHAVPVAEIIDILVELGGALDPATNAHVDDAYEAGLIASNYPPSILRNSYTMLPAVFDRAALTELVETRIGIDHLDGWVERTLTDGRTQRIRAFGSRAVHVPAGNGGVISALTIIRSALTKSDALIKIPSNDPLTAVAILRTLIEVAPNHPLTRHLAAAYWKGGDRAVESHIYQPGRVEKVVAWGGMASLTNVVRYIQPGLELVALDPKRSATIIGADAFADEATLDEVALRAATDVGVANQEACAAARVIYVQSGTDPGGIDRLEELGRRIFDRLQKLPDHVSTPAPSVDGEVADHLEATRMVEDFYTVVEGEPGAGAVVVSRIPERVDWSHLLSGRIANLVPVDEIDEVFGGITSFTQTIGVYPDVLKDRLRDQLPLYGAQRLTSLGYACHVSPAMPQDAIEPMRRMCKWIVDETCDPAVTPPFWETTGV